MSPRRSTGAAGCAGPRLFVVGLAAVGALFVVASYATEALAQPAPSAKPPVPAAASAARPAPGPARTARPLTDAELAAPPPGMGKGPHGTPAEGDDPHGVGNPHGGENPHGGGPPHGSDDGEDPHGGHGGGMPGMPRQSSSKDDPSLPPGTIAIEVRDGDGRLLPDVDVTLGMVVNSVAKGESRRRFSGRTNAEGNAVFEKLEIASNTAYRASVVRDGATYAAPPFALPKTTGTRATVIVYPVKNDLVGMSVAIQGFVFVEIKDEVLVIEQVYRVFNLGKETWLPKDVVLSLPEGWKALNSQQQMNDVGVDAVKDKGVRLRGTFAPGQSEASFRYQVPHDGSSEITLPIGVPPHVQSMQVVVEATKGLSVTVPGFPETMMKTGENGVRLLGTVRETQKPDPTFRSVEIRLANVPTKPWGRYGAAGLALGLCGLGLAFGLQRRADDPEEERSELRSARDRILREIEGLEAAFEAGEVGPKTHERIRRDLVEALAGVIARLEALPES